MLMVSRITKDLHKHLKNKHKKRKKKIKDFVDNIKYQFRMLKDKYHGRNNYILEKINNIEYKEQKYRIVIVGSKPKKSIFKKALTKIRKK